jgi:hypothetical protein
MRGHRRHALHVRKLLDRHVDFLGNVIRQSIYLKQGWSLEGRACMAAVTAGRAIG